MECKRSIVHSQSGKSTHAVYSLQVWLVESNFRDRIDGMMSENALLRRRLLQKTDQFSDYRNHTEMLQAQGIRSIREKVGVNAHTYCSGQYQL